MKRYIVNDASPQELDIWVENSDEEPDGEFIFKTLKEAKTHCLKRINEAIKDLEYNKSRIEDM